MKKRNFLLMCTFICTLFTFSARAENLTLSPPLLTGLSVEVTIEISNYTTMTSSLQILNFTSTGTQSFTIPPASAKGSYVITSMTFKYSDAGGTPTTFSTDLPGPGAYAHNTSSPAKIELYRDLSGNYTFRRMYPLGI